MNFQKLAPDKIIADMTLKEKIRAVNDGWF